MTGNGGDACRQRLYFSKLRGKIELKTCRGKGGQAAKNGQGGAGKSHFFLFYSIQASLRLFSIVLSMLTSFSLTPFPFLAFSVVYHPNTNNTNTCMDWSLTLFSIYFFFSGGKGGRGERGIKCSREEKSCSGGFVWVSCSYWCKEDGRLGEAARGSDGARGRDGQGFWFWDLV